MTERRMVSYKNTTGEKFFTKRRNQLDNAKSEYFPDVMALFSELVQNSDDAKSTELVLIFANDALYISNNGKSFNMGAERDEYGFSVGGDLESLSDIGERKKSNFVDLATGTHGTGFELIYYIANRFEVHWYDLEGDKVKDGHFASCSSIPEKLAVGETEWKWAKDGDDWILDPLFADNNDETRRGVTFKAPWRTKEQKDFQIGGKKPFQQSTSFIAWDFNKITELFETCKTYLPFMFQFCKNLTNIEIYLISNPKTEIELVKIERERSYGNDDYFKKLRKSINSELNNIKIGSYLIKRDELWKNAKDKNKQSVSLEIVRSLKSINFDNTKWINKESDLILPFAHFWGFVHPTTKFSSNIPIEPSEEQILSCWRSKSNISNIHNCISFTENNFNIPTTNCYNCERLQSKEQWKLARYPLVHINIPLFDISPYLEHFREKNRTFISSIMPLAMLTANRFFVSGDFHVNESRKEFKSDDLKSSIWNKSVASSIFTLFKKIFSIGLDDLYQLDVDSKKHFSLNLIPEKFSKWFKLNELHPHIYGQNWEENQKHLLYGAEGIWDKVWALSLDDELVSPEDIILPLDKTEKYSDSLAKTLKYLGLKVLNKEFYENLYSVSCETPDLLKKQFKRNSPYHHDISETTKKAIVNALLKFDSNSIPTLIRDDIPVHLAELSEEFTDEFIEDQPKTYADENQNYYKKSDFVIIPKDWEFFKKLYPNIRTMLPSLQEGNSPIVKLEKINVKSALNLFSLIDYDLEDSVTMRLVVKFANKVLDIEEGMEEKRQFKFIPVKYRGKWILKENNHVKKCVNCNSILPHSDWFESSKKCGCLEMKLENSKLDDQQFSRPDLMGISRSMIFLSSKDDIPEIILNNMYVAHDGIKPGLIDKAKEAKRTYSMIWCSSRTNPPEQRTVLDHKVVRKFLEDKYNLVTEELVQDNLLQLFELYADVYSTRPADTFHVYEDYENKKPACSLFDSEGKYYPNEDFILNVNEEVKQLLVSENNQLRILNDKILNVKDPKTKGFHWLANDNKSLFKIRNDIDAITIIKAISNILESYEDSNEKEKQSFCKSLSSIAMLILKSELNSDKGKSIFTLINKDSNHKLEFLDKEWVPIGSQTGFTSELVKWENFHLPGTKFFKIWGNSREHPILRDATGNLLTSHRHFSEEKWNWLVENSDELIKSTKLPEIPDAERMVYVLYNDYSIITDDLNLEDDYSKEFFELISDAVTSEYLKEIKQQFPNFSWKIPTKESIIIDPTSFGTTEESDIVRTIFPADKKSLVTSWVKPIIKMFDKLGIKSIKDYESAFSEYYNICKELDGKEPTEVQRKFITSCLDRVIKYFKNKNATSNGDDTDLWELIHDGIHDLRNCENENDDVKYLLPGKDRCYFNNQHIIYYDKSWIESFNSTFDGTLIKNSKSLGGIWSSHYQCLSAVFEPLYFSHNQQQSYCYKSIPAEKFAERFSTIISGKTLDESDAKKWNKALIDNEQIFHNSEINAPFAIKQGTQIKITHKNDINSMSELYTSREKTEIEAMLERTDAKLIIFDYVIPSEAGDFDELEKSRSRIYYELNSKIISSDKKVIPNYKSYMSDIFTALNYIADNLSGRLENFIDELDDLSELSQFEGYVTEGSLQTEFEYKGHKVRRTSNEKFVCENNEATIIHNFDERGSNQETILNKIMEKWLNNRSLNKGNPFFDECIKQIGKLTHIDTPKLWSESEIKLENLWENQDPKCQTELVLNPKKREANESINQRYRTFGCNLCGKKTPSIPNQEYEFEERKWSIVKRKGTNYRGYDNNTIGNILYLCPNHAQSYNKKCVKFEIKIGQKWQAVEELHSIPTPKPKVEDLRIIVWEGGMSTSSWGSGASHKSTDWNDYEFSRLIESKKKQGHGIDEDHAQKILDNLLQWIEDNIIEVI